MCRRHCGPVQLHERQRPSELVLLRVNEKSKNTNGNIINEMLMTFMKNMNQNLTDIMSQLALKATKLKLTKLTNK